MSDWFERNYWWVVAGAATAAMLVLGMALSIVRIFATSLGLP